MTYLVMSNAKKKSHLMMVRRQEEKRAKVAGAHVIADGNFQPSGISGVEHVRYPQVGIATGNPGVFPGYPYPYPSLPVPGPWGTGLAGTGHGFFSMCHVSDTV